MSADGESLVQAYGRELSEAYEWCQRYRQSRRDAELHQAWDLYYHVFKRINKQLPSLTVLELQYVAPALVRAQASLLISWLLPSMHPKREQALMCRRLHRLQMCLPRASLQGGHVPCRAWSWLSQEHTLLGSLW